MIKKGKMTSMQLLGISEARQTCETCSKPATNVWIRNGESPYITHTFHCCSRILGWNPQAGWQVVDAESSGPIPEVFINKKEGIA
tara:strand:- start:1405 stop:1659 length:255 start_codon:yes stop_codon:yes gene_type:complete